MIQSPCMGCKKRKPNCHGECVEYQNYKRTRNEELKFTQHKNSIYGTDWRA